MKSKYHIIIIGCGFAGLAAADILTRYNLDVLIIDENPHLGGQLLRKISTLKQTKKKFELDPIKKIGFELARSIAGQNIDILYTTQVLGLFPDHRILMVDHSEKIVECQGDFIICATGAREKYLPFKGWTIPGVMSTGAAQILMKSSGVLPAKTTLVGGTGPLQLALAAAILQNKGRVSAVLDQQNFKDKFGILHLWQHNLPKIIEGAIYLSRLFLQGTPIRQRTGIAEAIGKNQLEKVVTAQLDDQNGFIQGTERIYNTHALAVGYGFTPNIELPIQAGCDIKFDKKKGGWIVCVNEDTMETSLSAFFAVGEITGIAGAKKSYIEGRIAAWSILNQMELVNGSKNKANLRLLYYQRQHQIEYGAFLNAMCNVSDSAYQSIDDDTIICRCEEITMGDIRKTITDGFLTVNSIKKTTRCGMGLCQGRICGPVLFDILSGITHGHPGQIGEPSVRSPIKTVPLGAFLRANNKTEMK